MRKSIRANKGKLPKRLEDFVEMSDSKSNESTDKSDDDSVSSHERTLQEVQPDVLSSELVKSLMQRLTALETSSQLTTQKLVDSEAKRAQLLEELQCRNSALGTGAQSAVVTTNYNGAQYNGIVNATTSANGQQPSSVSNAACSSSGNTMVNGSAANLCHTATIWAQGATTSMSTGNAHNSMQQPTPTTVPGNLLYSNVYQPTLTPSYSLGYGTMQYSTPLVSSGAGVSANSPYVSSPMTSAGASAAPSNSLSAMTHASASAAPSYFLPPMTTAGASVAPPYFVSPMPSSAGASAATPYFSSPMASAAGASAMSQYCNTSRSAEACAAMTQQSYSSPVYNNYGQGMPFPHNGHSVTRKLYDLPVFDGRPEEWPVFISSFNESTIAYGYTMLENTFRLQKCLKGTAREEVEGLLINPQNVQRIIEHLEFRFGRPEILIRSQLFKAKEIAVIPECHLERLIGFATKVQNLSTFLQNANAVQQISNPTLLEELVSKMPMTKRIEWAAYASQLKPYPSLLHFGEWVSHMARVISMATLNMPPTTTVTTKAATGHQRAAAKPVLAVNEKSPPSQQKLAACVECGAAHELWKCSQFKNKTLPDRWVVVKNNHLCFSCLTRGHSISNCRRKKSCQVDGCKKIHNNLLHASNDNSKNAENFVAKSNNNDEAQKVNTTHMIDPKTTKLLFKILPIDLRGPNNRVIRTMAFLDEGSSATLIDEDIANQLGIDVKREPLSLQWFGGKGTNVSSMSMSIEIKGVKPRHKWYNLNARTVPNLDLSMQTVNLNELHHKYHTLKSLPISEYSNVVPKVLIGLDNCHVMSNLKSIIVGPSISAANTPLGWVVYGKPHSDDITTSCQLSIILHMKENVDKKIHEVIEQYFTTENFGVMIPIQPLESKEVIRAREILENTTRRTEGRYETGLLWRYDDIVLPDSLEMATNRLMSIESKMKKNAEFANAYKNEIDSFIKKGYARKLSPTEAAVKTPRTWYLAHFAVFNANKPGKLRLVFDAAAAIHGTALNSVLLKGPDEIQPLVSILFRFREHAIGLCADIREMFPQVRIREEDTCAQRFLWRSDSNMPIETYVMDAMIFGATCSPSSAQFIKNKNAREIASAEPRIIDEIVNNHYVDDYVSSFKDENEALAIGRRVKEVHSYAGFELRGFISNSSRVQCELNNVVQQDSSIINMNAKDSVDKVLGIHWDSGTDEFIFKLNFYKVDPGILTGKKIPTKRQFLSLVMSVYDPFGMLANLLLYGKVLLQKLWITGSRWDDEISPDIFEQFSEWLANLKLVEEFRLRRCHSTHLCQQGAVNELHVFVDASQIAFAAVAYWRIVTSVGIEVSFIAGKTRCAPLKMLSVQRLELQAAVLGTRLRSAIIEAHSIKPTRTTFWTDSQNVIRWINSDHRQYKPFVAHRVSEILETTRETDWCWLSTKVNAADAATRTTYPIVYCPNNVWVQGPEFLYCKKESWPKNVVPNDPGEADVEKRRCLLITPTDQIIDFSRFSKFLRLKRTIAWVLRPVHIFRLKQNGAANVNDALSVDELRQAEIRLCKLVQRDVYREEIEQLNDNKMILKTSKIFSLTPRYNDDGLLCVYGRLTYAMCLPESTRHPVILPKNHAFTKLLVRWYHEKFYHQNEDIVVNEIRTHYWIPELRSMVTSAKVNCQQCKNETSVPKPTIEGPLPRDRLTPYRRAFSTTGLDYFGPMLVTIGRRKEKRWAALFTCMATRAIHIELAADLSTDACILCIRNFVNRRGVPIKIRSDMGTNFVGADGELRKVKDIFDMQYIHDELAVDKIKWEFNCPANPSSGGCWERLIRTVKRVLAKTLKEQAPKVETLRSLLIEAENIVNSRPLTHVPVSATDLEPLTPNHILLGTTNSTQTPGSDEDVCTRKQYRIAEQLKNRFWRRWMREYLPTLTRRTKWFTPQKPIREGDVVLICDENMPRSQWRKGVVISTVIAKDGQIRIVEVKTSSGTLRRPISKLAVLDVLGEDPGSFTGGGMLPRGNVL